VPIRLRLGADPPPPHGCRPPLYTDVLADSRLIVAWKTRPPERDNQDSYGEGSETYFACVPGHSKHEFFSEYGGQSSYSSLTDLQLAGHYMAFIESGGSHYNNGSQGLGVVNALSGRYTFIERYPYGEGEPGGSVSSLALNSSGVVAWVKQELLLTGEPGAAKKVTGARETLAVRDGQRTYVLETAPSITHLSLTGKQVRWESSGHAHSRLVP